MGDGVNAGDLSDRILIEWDLGCRRAVAASTGHSQPAEPPASTGDRGAPVRRAGGAPVVGSEAGPAELVQIPDDIVSLRSADPDLGRQWRIALRDTLGRCLDEGGHVDAFTRDGWYIVRRH